MRRIAILFEYPSLLGGERSLLASIERLRGRAEFVAIAPPEGRLAAALRELKIAVWPSPVFDKAGRKRPREAVLASLREMLCSAPLDHLHGNSLAMGWLTGVLAKELPMRCTAHVRDILKLSRRAAGELNGNARLFAVSEAARRFHIAQGLDSERIVTIYNGVDTARFRPRPIAKESRHELSIPEEAFVTLTIGQIGLRKGWDTLAEALTIVAPGRRNIYSLFVGERYAEKPETIAYEQSVREILRNVMPNRARFLGYRRDIPELLAASDLVIHPARQEPFGRVLLEAAAAGRVILASDVGGTREMLDATAYLVPPDSPVKIAAGIESLAGDPDLRQELANAARDRVVSRFSADRAAEQFSEEFVERYQNHGH